MDSELTATAKKLGAQLKAVRESACVDLEAVSAQTKINIKYLQAVEEGDFDFLPAGFYRKNFIRSYCSVFGADKLWNEYEKLFAAEDENRRIVVEEMAEPVEEKNLIQDINYKPENNKTVFLTAAMAVLLAVVFAVVFRGVITTGTKTEKANQLNGGTAMIIEQQKAREAEAERISMEKARKLAEERAKAEEAERMEAAAPEAQKADEDGTKQTEALPAGPSLAKNELYIYAPEKDITVKISKEDKVIFNGKIAAGKGMVYKVTGDIPVRVRYENPNKTEVRFGGAEFKPLHPSSEGRSRYYWSDGQVTFTKQKTAN